MFSSIKRILFVAALLGSAHRASAGRPPFCPNATLSCHNTTVIANTCCFNAPGGQLLQTQFWDTDPATGPADHWTVHGLWPDHCDGTYDSYCDETRQYTNITQILEAYNRYDVLKYMRVYWKDNGGDDESFWEHEWGKHGTCISTLDPNCYIDYTPQEEVVDFFERTVRLFSHLNTYEFLAAANIYPTNSTTYTYDQIMSALNQPRGVNATIECDGKFLDQVYYTFDVRGSVANGQFVPENPVGEGTTGCPKTGIQYVPKNLSTVPTPVSSSATVSAAATGKAKLF
ncbi:Ribonuclease T2-like [Lasallia pustulata]|uniref:ribonuclease T2 n=1 Tax=Lasallia pustulata TaxID=136370 RepID=A0A1W5D0D9_9LECA|nr:Ribonuclease T2-like [Lasallia pustulata]